MLQLGQRGAASGNIPTDSWAMQPHAASRVNDGSCPLFWALLASGQITMRKVNGWQTLGETITAPTPVDLAA